MKKFWSIALILALATAGGALAQVTDTRHDLSDSGPNATYSATNTDRICVFCHTPHQPTGTSTDPLWNHDMPVSQTYGVYGSGTMDATPTEVGGSGSISELCMSCHDGTVAVGAIINDPTTGAGGVETVPDNNTATEQITGYALVGTDLTNDHPVNFAYADGGAGLQPAAGIGAFLPGGDVQCSSCHDPHNDSNVPFLRIANTNSDLCKTCHIK